MSKRKFQWDFAAYLDPEKNAIQRQAHTVGANLSRLDKAYLVRRVDNLACCKIFPVKFIRRTYTGFYVLFEEANRVEFLTYAKGWMVCERKHDAETLLLLHYSTRYVQLKSQADVWEERFKSLSSEMSERIKRENEAW